MRSIMYFAIQYLGIPYSLTETNLKHYLFFGIREGYTQEELLKFIGLDKKNTERVL